MAKCLTKLPPRKRKIKEQSRVRGFFRIAIENPDGTIAGDSGWCENTIGNQGYKLYLTDNIGKSAGSKQVAYIALGTGGLINATDTILLGEITGSTQRTAVTYANASSKSATFTATFNSSSSFLAASSNLSNVGLFSTTTTSDTIFSGNTFTSSACATNQNVNCTYTIAFS